MDIIDSKKHKLRDYKTELNGGELVCPHERQSLIDCIPKRINEVALGSISGPNGLGIDPINKIHDADFIHFLKMAWAE